MKTKSILAAALCALVLVGCGKKGADKFKEVKLDGKNVSATDSIGYYMGETMAVQVDGMAKNDTLLKDKKARENFDEGFYAGLEAVTGDNEAFNLGFVQGVSVAFGVSEQLKAMGENVDIAAIASGYTNAFDKNGNLKKKVEEESSMHSMKLQALMSQMQGKAQQKKNEEFMKKTEAAKKKLVGEAKKGGYTDVNGYYVKTLAAGKGKLKNGQKVAAVITLKDGTGKEVYPSQPIPQTIGEASNLSPAIDAIVSTVEMNGKYQIIGTVEQIFGKDVAAQVVQQGQVDPSQLYILEYEVAPESTLSNQMQTPPVDAAPDAPVTPAK